MSNRLHKSAVLTFTVVLFLLLRPSWLRPGVSGMVAQDRGHGYDGFHYSGNFISSQAELGTWELIETPVAYTLLSAGFAAPGDGWAVGVNGQIFKWDGIAWSTHTSPVSVTLYAIQVLAADNAWAVGAEGAILHWDGSNWTPQASPTDYNLFDLTFLSPELGWAVGGKVIDITTFDRVILAWDGTAWREVPSPESSPLNWELVSISMSSSSNGWAGGGTSLLRWNGSIWEEFSNDFDDIKSIVALNEDNAWIVGRDLDANTGFVDHWDGEHWYRVHTAQYQIRSLSMVSPDFGWAVGGNFETDRGGSLILHWDGQRWTPVASPIGLPLNFVWALDRADGWILAGGDNVNTGFEGGLLRYHPFGPTEASATTVMPTTIVATSNLPSPHLTVTPTVVEVPNTEIPNTTTSHQLWRIAPVAAVVVLLLFASVLIALRLRRKA